MTQNPLTPPKPESLLELVERLDAVHTDLSDEAMQSDTWTDPSYDEWPRLRDALRDLTQAARSAIRLLPHPTSEEASTLEMEIEARGYLTQALARLDCSVGRDEEAGGSSDGKGGSSLPGEVHGCPATDDEFRRHGIDPENCS